MRETLKDMIVKAIEAGREGALWDLRSAFDALPVHIAGDPADDDDEEEEEDDDEEDKEDKDKDAGSSGSGSGSADDVKDPEKKRLSDEAAKYRRRAREARQRAEAAETKIAEAEAAKKPELERLQADLKAANERAEKAEERSSKHARSVAISQAAEGKNVKDLEYLGHLLDKLQDIEYVDEDGEVVDLSDEVDALIKKHSILVDEGKTVDDDDDDNPSGRPMNGKKKKGKETDIAALAKRFPALQR